VIANFTKKGRIEAGTGVGIARSEIGLAMRSGATRPDITTPETFRQTMLNASTVAYKVRSSSGTAFEAIMKRLEITERMRPRLRTVTSGRVAELVARGEAEFAVQLIPELLPVAGIELAGAFPPALQRKTGPLTAAVGAGAKQASEAKALIAFLTEPASLKAMMATGLQAP
jgi:molybdate transport system substrate-binding protein